MSSTSTIIAPIMPLNDRLYRDACSLMRSFSQPVTAPPAAAGRRPAAEELAVGTYGPPRARRRRRPAERRRARPPAHGRLQAPTAVGRGAERGGGGRRPAGPRQAPLVHGGDGGGPAAARGALPQHVARRGRG